MLAPTSPDHEHLPVSHALVSADGQPLPLKSTRISGRLCGGLARLTVEQVFDNPYPEVLDLDYRLPLPVDASVCGYSFTMGERRVQGELQRKAEAEERFAEALTDGHTASLLEADDATLFSQRIGNVPPKQSVVVRIELDQQLRWVPIVAPEGGGWEWRFPTIIAPRYRATEPLLVQTEPRDIALEVDVQIADDTTGPAFSPSHGFEAARGGHMTLPPSSGVMNRDLVLRWPVSTPDIGLQLDVVQPDPDGDAFARLTVVPPREPTAPIPRDLILLLDTSGSMHGEPLAQTRRLAAALVQGLGPEDSLEMVEFSSTTQRFTPGPETVDDPLRGRALGWLAELKAGGGTNMVPGIVAALKGLRPDAQRQVVVLTDGYIGVERDVVATIVDKLPERSRLHVVGVGSAVNRGLTANAARAGRGSEHIIGLGEDIEVAVENVRRSLEAPLVVGLTLHGDALAEHAPAHLPDLFAGQPAHLAVRLRPGGGTLRLSGQSPDGRWQCETAYRAPVVGEDPLGIAASYARERIADLELRIASGAHPTRVEAAIEALALRHRIATRLTSWVAVNPDRTVEADAPRRSTSVPQELPHGSTQPKLLGCIQLPGVSQRVSLPPGTRRAPPTGRASRRKAREERVQPRTRSIRRRGPSIPPWAPEARPSPETVSLRELAALLGTSVDTLLQRASALGFGSLRPDDPVDAQTAGALGRDRGPDELGMAEVLVVTRGSDGLRAHCRVARGKVCPATAVRVLRGGTLLRHARISTVRVDGKSTVRAPSGSRCDVVVVGCDDLNPGDHLVVSATVR